MKIAETLNNFFGNVIKKHMIPKYSEYDLSIDRVENRTIRAVLKYRNHPSILAIPERKKVQINVCFKEVSIEEIQKEILNLNNKKAFDIPTKIIKENSDTFGKLLRSFINDSVKSFTFLSFLKDADVTPILKNGKKDKKEKYRLVSIIAVLSKIFERILFIQMFAFLKTFLTNSNVDSVKVIKPKRSAKNAGKMETISQWRQSFWCIANRSLQSI